MRWSNVEVILRREVRDQLRDRRTLMMIFVLPVLLYPMIGIGAAKLGEAFKESVRTVVLIGPANLPESGYGPGASATAAGVGVAAAVLTPGPVPLLNEAGDGFNPALFDDPADAGKVRVEAVPPGTFWSDPPARRAGLRMGKADVVVEIPADFGSRLRDLDRAELPIYYNSADEKSQLTFLRVDRLLERYRERIVARRLALEGKPEGFTDPVRPEGKDVATAAEAGSTVWAKIFPFLLVMMALTGAFYPAVDLCAGEKERGTMETLLISPATRGEIVMGKFFTIMLFSMGTAVLNLASMGLTAWLLARQINLAPAGARQTVIASMLAAPSPMSFLWMALLLVPMAGFLSAVCLALAILARSMKEGQYYMTPLYMVALPLIFVTLMPGIELSPYTCLIPITGATLLLKALMLGEYGEARRYFLPVMLPILVYGLIALRWAVDQFTNESVLFREAERFDLRAWLVHLRRDRGPRPGMGQALACFLLMILGAWVAINLLPPSIWNLAVLQVGVILLVPAALAFWLTSDPAGTLRLARPSPRWLAIGVALAFTLNPLVNELRAWVEWAFPTSEAVKRLLEGMLEQIPTGASAFLLLALLPGICEEVAFRGFILSGLRTGRRTSSSVVLSAFLFGFLHVVLSLVQQLFNATLLGIVLGLLAIRSRSLLPGIAFHVLNNGLGLATGWVLADPRLATLAGILYRDRAQGLYHGHWVALGALASAALIGVLARPERAPAPPEDAPIPQELAGSERSR
jgi:sodium transport system permease protein